MTLVQLTLRDVTDKRVKDGARPVFELDLEDHEQVVGVQFCWDTSLYRNRKTTDYHASVWVATRCEGTE